MVDSVLHFLFESVLHLGWIRYWSWWWWTRYSIWVIMQSRIRWSWARFCVGPNVNIDYEPRIIVDGFGFWLLGRYLFLGPIWIPYIYICMYLYNRIMYPYIVNWTVIYRIVNTEKGIQTRWIRIRNPIHRHQFRIFILLRINRI